ncbi:MAG TPA: hypothetical protein VFI95_24280, partial [Terriglobales bacterium]|nr:hypothetical protein [Terriglobales bacterium]
RVDMKASPSAMLEDPESVQVALMDLITQLLERQIRWREASLVIRALEAAQRNVRLVRFGQKMEEMVSELPNWDKQFLEEHPEYAGDDGPADGKADSAPQSGT